MGLRILGGYTAASPAVAGGRALAARLGVTTSLEVARLARGGDADAVQAIRDSGRALGEVLAGCVQPATHYLVQEAQVARLPGRVGREEVDVTRTDLQAETRGDCGYETDFVRHEPNLLRCGSRMQQAWLFAGPLPVKPTTTAG